MLLVLVIFLIYSARLRLAGYHRASTFHLRLIYEPSTLPLRKLPQPLSQRDFGREAKVALLDDGIGVGEVASAVAVVILDGRAPEHAVSKAKTCHVETASC